MRVTRFTHAIVSRIPNSVQLDAGGKGSSDPGAIDLVKARKEQEVFRLFVFKHVFYYQEELCETLREAGVDVIELAPEDSAPASTIFVEDLAIVCNGTALITRPLRPNRRKEVAALLSELGLQVLEIDSNEGGSGKDNKVMLEGSDVLFTGKEFFLGLTKQTNLGGAMELAKTFPEFPVTPIKVNSGGTLKKFVSLAAPNVLAVGSSKEAQEVLKRVEREATFRYSTVTIPREEAVNCLSINNSVVFRSEWPEVTEKLSPLTPDSSLRPVQLTELSKLGGLLSQHVILFRRIKLLKRL